MSDLIIKDDILKELKEFLISNNSNINKETLSLCISELLYSLESYSKNLLVFLSPNDIELLNELKEKCNSNLNRLKNGNKIKIYSSSLSWTYDFFLSEEKAKEHFIKGINEKIDFEYPDGVEFKTEMILVNEITDYFSEKEIIDHYGTDWKEKIGYNK